MNLPTVCEADSQSECIRPLRPHPNPTGSAALPGESTADQEQGLTSECPTTIPDQARQCELARGINFRSSDRPPPSPHTKLTLAVR